MTQFKEIKSQRALKETSPPIRRDYSGWSKPMQKMQENKLIAIFQGRAPCWLHWQIRKPARWGIPPKWQRRKFHFLSLFCFCSYLAFRNVGPVFPPSLALLLNHRAILTAPHDLTTQCICLGACEECILLVRNLQTAPHKCCFFTLKNIVRTNTFTLVIGCFWARWRQEASSLFWPSADPKQFSPIKS